ncbi:MAG: metallophosphoesterase, partial [Acidimicrobiia bacterium]|nr:metallophosphoesterase [Acidimicrobiia bacterium]
RVGFIGGTGRTLFDLGPPNPLEGRFDALGPVDILCTHVAPAIPALSTDVITGRPERSSKALLGYLQREQPAFHFFGDIHQPKAREWQIGATHSRNVGYFRATGLPTRHAARGKGR